MWPYGTYVANARPMAGFSLGLPISDLKQRYNLHAISVFRSKLQTLFRQKFLAGIYEFGYAAKLQLLDDALQVLVFVVFKDLEAQCFYQLEHVLVVGQHIAFNDFQTAVMSGFHQAVH